MNRVRADFGVKINADSTVTVGRSSVEVPQIQWNGSGIKWFDDNQLLHKEPTYRVYTSSKTTGMRVEVLCEGLTESEAQAYVESWGWSYDDGHRSFWMDYEVEE